MFTSTRRDHVRERVLDVAKSDPRVLAGALTGSTAVGSEDGWSDIDVAFGIADGVELDNVLDDWTTALDKEFGVLDHFDIRPGASIYRVFLLPDGLEIDMGVSPANEFGPRGPQFRPLFGPMQKLDAVPRPDARHLMGLCWHHVLHARSCIERAKPWQAEYWISALRDHMLALTCLRLGEDAFYGRGVDRLPAAATRPLEDALVRSLTEPELRRALTVVTACLIDELEAWDPALGARLSPTLREFGAPQASAEHQRTSHDAPEE